MKIAFIGQKGIPAQFGGVEKHTEELAVRIARAGHQVFVYARNNYIDKNLKKYKGVNIIHLPTISTKNLDAISHTFLATLHALFHNYDVIHYQSIGPSSLLWIVKWLKRKTAVVSTFHCQDYYHQKWGFLARAYLRIGEWVSCKVPDRTIVVSRVLGNYAKEKYGIEAEVIPNGSPIKDFPVGSEKLAIWNLKEKKYILSVSRLVKHKGIHYLIEAFKQLEDTNKVPNNFKLVIAGDGFHTDDYVKYLKTISQGRENIIFTGNQTGKNLEQIFANSYVFVQPSEAEGLSLALLEAMGYGLPVLVSDIKENLEAIEDTGYTFRCKNVDDLRDKLAYIINRPEEAKKMGENSRRRVTEKFSWDSIAQKTLKVYADILKAKKC